MRLGSRAIALGFGALCLACGGEDDGRGTSVGFPTGAGTLTASDSGGSASATDAADDDDEDADDDAADDDDAPGESSASSGEATEGDAPKFDLGVGPDASMPMADECTKVDILFAIDNSGSMAGEQANLIAAFPGFVAGIQEALAFAESYHIGVVTSDSYNPNEAGCQGVGDLVTQTGGSDSSGGACGPYTSGFRWFDDTEPDLASTFACAAQVGTDGSGDEEQVHGVLRATDAMLNSPGACNDGFLRDDALLVVVLITDEEDEEDCIPIIGCDGGTPADPPQWFTRLVTNKFNVETNIVMLSLVGLPGSDCADNASRIQSFASMFTNHAEGEICSGNYAEFFTQAISQIDTACEEFLPPG